MQPLARQSDANPEIVEQWQLVVNGWEIIKAYSELVDPKLQQENFDAQSAALEKWDDEATSGDDDFVLAMEYGMPPQSGWGMGVERLITLLTGQDNLRDVVLFPLMKPENPVETKKTTNVAVVILNEDANLENWQELNTAAHLAASLAARKWGMLFDVPTSKTQDGVEIPMNIWDAIMIQVWNNDAIQNLWKELSGSDVDIFPFTREMMESSDDTKVSKEIAQKMDEQIEKLWVILYGERKAIEKLTKDFQRYS